MEEQTKEQQIAYSFINGNLSWVKNELKNSPSLVAKVHHELEFINGLDINSESRNFMAWVMTW